MDIGGATNERYGITINTERCTGCGACVEICPSGALYLVDGKAAVDNSLCRGCEACLSVCPVGALALVAQPEAADRSDRRFVRPAGRAPAQSLTRRPVPEAIRIRTESAPVPWRERVLPVVGAALAWAGREIVPRVVDVVLDTFDRQTAAKSMAAQGRNSGAPSKGREGKGRQHRHRRRGGS